MKRTSTATGLLTRSRFLTSTGFLTSPGFLKATGFFAAALLLSLGACDDNGTRPGDEIVFPDKDVSYMAHVQPFFDLRCANYGCHEDQTRAGNISLTSYVAMTERPGIIISGDPESSLLLQKIDGRLPHPINVPILINSNQLAGIRKWILEGAKNN